jgi:4-hydroxy-tetrahydrodipicolinate synthase
MFEGAITAMVTPFRKGKVDADQLRKNVEFQIKQGINALVPTGTTGESPTLSHDEHKQVIEVVVEAVNGRVPVIAGTGSNSTDEAIALTQHAAKVGVSGSLQVSPYYNKPTQAGLYAHFMAIADAVELPMVLYNIPGRCGVTIEASTIARLAEHDNIVAVKEATGSLDMASEIASLCEITILSGDDSLTLPLASVGGRGVISVLSNIIPAEIRKLTDACLAGDMQAARDMHLKHFPLFKGMFTETNPIPVKTAMAMLEMDNGEMRLPLTAMSEPNRVRLEALLQEHELLD